MPVPTEPIWDIKPHTKSKHEILSRYLGAWFGIMGPINQRVVYLDGFCGPGRYKKGEPGSPIIALEIACDLYSKNRINKATFVFVDERSDRLSFLKNEISQLNFPSNFDLIVEHNQFENTLSNILIDLETKGVKIAPTFAFIDPFGFKGAPYALIQRLLQNKKTEIFITIMVDSINRFLEHPDPQITNHIIELYGTEDVLQIIEKEDNRIEELIQLYHKQLLKIAKYVRFFKMGDKNNRPIYCLFFATNNRLGHLKMKEAFWKVDPTSGYKFSDATNPNQLILFEDDHSGMLADLIASKFSDQEVIVETIRKFVEDDTAFTKSHMKKALLYLENQDKIFINQIKKNGEKRRKGTFPDDVIITF